MNKKQKIIGHLHLKDGQVAKITEIKYTDYAQESYVRFILNGRNRKVRMYDTIDKSLIIINKERYDLKEIY